MLVVCIGSLLTACSNVARLAADIRESSQQLRVVSGTLEGFWVHWAAPAIVVNRYLHEEVTLLNAGKLNGFSGSEEVERRRLVSKRASADTTTPSAHNCSRVVG